MPRGHHKYGNKHSRRLGDFTITKPRQRIFEVIYDAYTSTVDQNPVNRSVIAKRCKNVCSPQCIDQALESFVQLGLIRRMMIGNTGGEEYIPDVVGIPRIGAVFNFNSDAPLEAYGLKRVSPTIPANDTKKAALLPPSKPAGFSLDELVDAKEMIARFGGIDRLNEIADWLKALK
jgi:hypothetical protein